MKKEKPKTSDVTYAGVLEMLNSCKSVEPQNAGTQNCNDVCSGNGNKICIKADVATFDSEINKWVFDTGTECESGKYDINNVNEAGGLKLQCLCCSP